MERITALTGFDETRLRARWRSAWMRSGIVCGTIVIVPTFVCLAPPATFSIKASMSVVIALLSMGNICPVKKKMNGVNYIGVISIRLGRVVSFPAVPADTAANRYVSDVAHV